MRAVLLLLALLAWSVPARAEIIAVFGDSLAEGLHLGLQLETKGTARVLPKLTRVGFGLTTPDYEQSLGEAVGVARANPGLRVFVMVGANDQRGLRGADRKTRVWGSPEWGDVYAERVREVVDRLQDAGADVVWVSLPAMRTATMEGGARTIDRVTLAAAAAAGARTVDVSTHFRDEQGRFAMAPGTGELRGVVLRAEDGVHFTGRGYRALARAVLDALTP
jgi:hypothetical protein